MNVFLTGAYGNIGYSTLSELIERGHTVHTFDVPTEANKARASAITSPHLTAHWGDIRDKQAVESAMQTAQPHVVVHLAFIIPPMVDEQPELARAVNLDGTRHVIETASALAHPPRLLFASTFDLYGRTQSQPPPRKVTDAVVASDEYTAHKLQGEEWVRASGLTWCIFRFADVPLLALRDPHPIMFEIPLNTRIEVLHTRDAALAITNGLESDAIWGKVFNIGGGKNCQVIYGDYLDTLLGAMGLGGGLPAEAFTQKEYLTDWLDTEESQALLQYQRHTFYDVVGELQQVIGWKRYAAMVARPAVRRNMLKMSPYYRK